MCWALFLCSVFVKIQWDLWGKKKKQLERNKDLFIKVEGNGVLLHKMT